MSQLLHAGEIVLPPRQEAESTHHEQQNSTGATAMDTQLFRYNVMVSYSRLHEARTKRLHAQLRIHACNKQDSTLGYIPSGIYLLVSLGPYLVLHEGWFLINQLLINQYCTFPTQRDRRSGGDGRWQCLGPLEAGDHCLYVCGRTSRHPSNGRGRVMVQLPLLHAMHAWHTTARSMARTECC